MRLIKSLLKIQNTFCFWQPPNKVIHNQSEFSSFQKNNGLCKYVTWFFIHSLSELSWGCRCGKFPKDHLGLITSQHHFLHLVQDQKPSSVLVLNVNVLRANLTWLPKYVISVTLHLILSLSRTNTLLGCLLKWLEGKFKVKVHFYSNRLGHVDMVKFSEILVQFNMSCSYDITEQRSLEACGKRAVLQDPGEILGGREQKTLLDLGRQFIIFSNYNQKTFCLIIWV